MTPKQYLQQVAQAERDLRTLKAKLAHYEELGIMSSLSNGNTPVKASKGHSRVETAAIGIVDTLSEMMAKIADYTAIITQAQKLIDRIPQENYRKLLTLHYLCGWKLPRVGEELRYEDRNSVYRAHGWALLELGKVLKEKGAAGNG